MSWKHTPQASTLITMSFGPGVGSAIVSILRTPVPPGARTTIALISGSLRLEHQQRHVAGHILEHRLDRDADAQLVILHPGRIGEHAHAAVEPHLNDRVGHRQPLEVCLLYTSDAADELS